MANAFIECSYCGQEVLLPNVQPSTTLNAEQVSVLLEQFTTLLSPEHVGQPCVSLEEQLVDIRQTLQTMNREFLEAERADDEDGAG